MQAHTARLLAVAFLPCEKRLAAGGRDRVVILWDSEIGKAEYVLQSHTELVRSQSFLESEAASLCSMVANLIELLLTRVHTLLLRLR